MKILFFLFLFFIEEFRCEADLINCPPTWQQFNSTCYLMPGIEGSSWDEAQSFCEAMYNGKLAEPETIDEKQIILSLCSKKSCWIGGTDRYHEEGWVWFSSNRTVSLSVWAQSERSGYNEKENCLAVNTKIYDDDCSVANLCLCEIKLSNAETETTTAVYITENEDTTIAVDITTNEDTTTAVGITTNEDTTTTVDITTNEDTTTTVDITTNEDTTTTVDITTNEDTTTTVDITTNQDTTTTVDITTNEDTTTTVDITTNEDTTTAVAITTDYLTIDLNLTAYVGSNITLYCPVVSQTSVEFVNWTRIINGSEYNTSSDSYNGTENGTLTLTNLALPDGGIYKCQVELNREIQEYIIMLLVNVYGGSSSSGSLCPCSCDYEQKLQYWANHIGPILTQSELTERLHQIEEKLKINKTGLSSYIRTKTSAADKRVSSTGIGYSGACVLGIVFGIVILLDISTCLGVINNKCKSVKFKC